MNKEELKVGDLVRPVNGGRAFYEDHGIGLVIDIFPYEILGSNPNEILPRYDIRVYYLKTEELIPGWPETLRKLEIPKDES
jgi:hypothetical protein